MNLCGAEDRILACVDSYEWKGKIWIFVELMDGGALTDMVVENAGKLTEEICAYILRETLYGLDFLHSKSIIHRDIKSDNILFNTEGDIKLADFGYATQLTKKRRGTVSQVGTVCWMAPELIAKKKNGYNEKIDVWSYGIFAIELSNGEPPYLMDRQDRVLYNIMKKKPPKVD